MKKITDVTRQDIIDIIKNGFYEEFDEPYKNWETGQMEMGQTVFMPYYGRLEVVDFLDRIYNLDDLESNDSRYSTARYDIANHLGWGDIDSDFVFSDSRFQLTRLFDDEPLLRFMCEMLNPVVRVENGNWRKYLEAFNDLLKPDGYELYSHRKISGREVFDYREIDHVEIKRDDIHYNANLKLIGEGSYAKVYKFKDEFYNKFFALKRAKDDLNEKELSRFKLEFEEMQRIDSQYVLEVYSYDNQKNEYIMEFMDKTLEKYINENNAKLTLPQRRFICVRILNAFEALHKKGIFHRDISPKNILIKEYADGPVFKISDFGLVKIPDSDLTSTNTEIKGYLNDPSLRITGFKNYSIEHEIYALTLLIVFVLTGKTNYSSIKNADIIKLINNGTNPQTDKRYKDVSELKRAVLSCIDSMDR